jgi:hypothetical protein
MLIRIRILNNSIQLKLAADSDKTLSVLPSTVVIAEQFKHFQSPHSDRSWVVSAVTVENVPNALKASP